jgi:thiamine biosynthesis lipoprotein
MRNDTHTTRRRALRIFAGVAGLPLMIAGVRATASKAQAHTWQGNVLGAASELSLWHTDAAFARATILKARTEIERLERIFSLYRPDSEISRLNASGSLARPSRDLLTLIEQGQRFSELSSGAFDVSVQPLWKLYEAHFWSHTDTQPDFTARAHDTARALVDYRSVDTGSHAIGFARPGMAITLNSIAQGYITDSVADLLRNEGFENAVVDLGEIRTLGHHPDGRPWRLGIRDAKSIADIERTVELDNAALAVSGGYGTTFDDSGRIHHIFDPRTGESANRITDAAVIGPSATIANGIATAICAGGETLAAKLLAAYPKTRAILTRLDGSLVEVGPNRASDLY